MSKTSPPAPHQGHQRRADSPNSGACAGAAGYDSAWAAFTIVIHPLHCFRDTSGHAAPREHPSDPPGTGSPLH
jgi:hypothetical protein